MQRVKGGERCREQREGGRRLNATLGLGLEKTSYLYLLFFLSAGLVEPVRFGYVQSVSDFENETEPNRNFFVFFNRLIRFFFRFGFFGYCFFDFLGLIGLSFFLLSPTLCHVL